MQILYQGDRRALSLQLSLNMNHFNSLAEGKHRAAQLEASPLVAFASVLQGNGFNKQMCQRFRWDKMSPVLGASTERPQVTLFV